MDRVASSVPVPFDLKGLAAHVADDLEVKDVGSHAGAITGGSGGLPFVRSLAPCDWKATEPT